MTPVKYCGTFLDYSGYGQANRNIIASLYTAGVDLATELVVQVPERGQFGWVGELAKSLSERNIPYKIKIIHLTPDMYPRYMEPGMYHIGHLFWETDRLPAEWVRPCNQMNEIWTASEKQAEMIKNSGVTVPVFFFPQPIDTQNAETIHPPYIVPNFEGFKFYAIFQWIERKNPKALLSAYWKTFTGKSDVVLLLKTYRVNYTDSEFNKIREEVAALKQELKLDHYPRVILLKKLMKTDEMFRLHKTGDCYVTTSRGEGWCIPAVEGMLVGNPVIGIDQTGYADYMTDDIYYPCKTELTQVVPVSWIPWYTADQKWLEISEKDLSRQMLQVYNNQKKAEAVGWKAQKFIKDNFNYWTVGEAMKNRLEELEKFL